MWVCQQLNYKISARKMKVRELVCFRYVTSCAAKKPTESFPEVVVLVWLYANLNKHKTSQIKLTFSQLYGVFNLKGPVALLPSAQRILKTPKIVTSRWNIEIFFKLIKQNLQIKIFVGKHPNSCKSQLLVRLIVYFLLELVRRAVSKVRHRFGYFATLIFTCLIHYIGVLMKYVIKKARESKFPCQTVQKMRFV